MAKDSDKIIADQAKQISELKKQLAKKREQEATELEDIVDYTQDILAKETEILEAVERRVNAEKTLSDAIKQRAGKLDDEAKSQLDAAKAAEASLITEKKRLQELQNQSKLTAKILKNQLKYGDELEKSLGFLDNIADSIDSIPVVGGILSKALGVDDLKERIAKDLTKSFTTVLQGATDESASFKDKLLSGFKGFKQGASGMLKSLKSINPYAIAIAAAVIAIKKGLDLDQETTELARNLGISKDEAQGIHSELMGVAQNTKVIGADTEELTKAYMELAKGLGGAKFATAELAETQVLLTKQFGLAGEEAIAFQKMAMASGKTAEQNVAAIKGITDEMTGGMMNYKEVMKDVAGTSKAVQATFKGNIGQLTKAVITAKKFGKTLDDVKKITDGLLDIEGSIEKEMQARVLTGKDMNFDLARSLKLRGEEEKAFEEVMKQAGSYSELMAMAPYQLEATAEAAGMTVDELVAGAEQQKLFNDLSNKLGHSIKTASDLREEDLSRLTGQTAEQAKALVMQEQQASAQEKIAQLGNRIMAIFGKIIEPVMEIVNPLMDLVDIILPAVGPLIKFAFAPVMMVVDAVKGIAKIINGDILEGLTDIGKGVVKYLLRPFTLVWDLIKGFMPDTAKALTTPLIDTPKNATKKQNDAMIGSDGGLVVSGARGTYQLAADDTVIAGTNLGGASTATANTSAPATTNNDMAELVGLMKQLIASVNQPAVIKIGNKVVTEMDRMQTMNRSYVGKVDNSYGAV